jgi:hypothetical protein
MHGREITEQETWIKAILATTALVIWDIQIPWTVIKNIRKVSNLQRYARFLALNASYTQTDL